VQSAAFRDAAVGRSLVLAAFVALAGPLDLLTRCRAPLLTPATINKSPAGFGRPFLMP